MCILYVIQCETPRTWYVGTTLSTMHHRLQQHRSGYGSKWTARHGCKRLKFHFQVGEGEASQLENEVWMHYARIYGPTRVRGGDVTICQRGTDDIPDWLMPEEFGGARLVYWG